MLLDNMNTTTTTTEIKCVCGKEMRPARQHEAGYLFCSTACKEIGLEAELQSNHEKVKSLDELMRPLAIELEKLSKTKKTLDDRNFHIYRLRQDTSKKAKSNQ